MVGNFNRKQIHQFIKSLDKLILEDKLTSTPLKVTQQEKKQKPFLNIGADPHLKLKGCKK